MILWNYFEIFPDYILIARRAFVSNRTRVGRNLSGYDSDYYYVLDMFKNPKSSQMLTVPLKCCIFGSRSLKYFFFFKKIDLWGAPGQFKNCQKSHCKINFATLGPVVKTCGLSRRSGIIIMIVYHPPHPPHPHTTITDVWNS